MRKNLTSLDYYRVNLSCLFVTMRFVASLSQSQASKLIGIDVANLSRLEHGRYSPGYDMLCRILAVYSARIDRCRFKYLMQKLTLLNFYPTAKDIRNAELLLEEERSACSRRRPSPVAKGAGHCMSGASVRFKPCADAVGCEEHAK